MNLSYENAIKRKGFKVVAGLDEAGRGPLAGPVFACALAVIGKIPKKILKEVNDSKKLTAKKREEVYNALINEPNIVFSVSFVSQNVIDKINILQATKEAMKRAAKKISADFLLIDGNFKIETETAQISIIKGDLKIFSCAAASIISKVARDKKMLRLHEKFPLYGFDKHKGYPTKRHYEMIKKYGPCFLHRKSFRLCDL